MSERLTMRKIREVLICRSCPSASELDLRLYGGLLVVFVAGSALALVPDCTKQAAVASVK